jgi:hypothetical protein
MMRRIDAAVPPSARPLLGLAGGGSLAVAALHVVLPFSIPLCRFCGAPDWVLTASLTVRLVLVWAVAFVFGTSGAAVLRPLRTSQLPRRDLLVTSGAIYTLRGSLLAPELLIVAGLLHVSAPLPPQELLFSLISLGIGLAHLGAARALRAATSDAQG